MFNGKRVAVVLPAYNAEKTLAQTYSEIPRDLVDDVILVDDSSKDETASLGRKMGLTVFTHPQNRGYGGSQKTGYEAALARGADIVVMVHADYQYSPKFIPSLLQQFVDSKCEIILGSRLLDGNALSGGMPFYKYVSNRFLTAFQNFFQHANLSEYHTGYRAYTKEALNQINWRENSDDFIFDNQFLAQVLYKNLHIEEFASPAKYFPEASSINFTRSLRYGFGCLWIALLFRMNRWGFLSSPLFRSVH